ncbi:MAG TPA: hypothetical protein VE988_16770 [Gemmataceae bacterium]|nr:hypothetical protein [Gemmataceae bacterium]
MSVLHIRGHIGLVTATLIFWAPALAFGQEQVRLVEALPPGAQYNVSCRVDVTGSLTLPLEKGQTTPKTLAVSGTSVIDYHERVLTLNPQQHVKTTIRMYRKLDFERKVGDQRQSTTLRPEVRRMVILRQNQVEVPFSPDGPMTWNELDLVRTDVFTPALVGLLPAQAVKLNDRWQAAAYSIQELTDLDKIEEGIVTCQLDQLTKVNGRRQARVSFKGAVRGVGEDGPTRHTLDGYLLFDAESNHISYVTVRGTQQLLDKDGKTVGKIEGTFVLTRRPEASKDLSDAVLRTLKLEPNEDNTQLLYDNPELGLRFLHPRRWRVAGVRGQQLGLDENSGSGLLLTLEPLKELPTAAQFLQESRTYLEQQKAKILRVDPVRQLQGGAKAVDQFALEVEIGGQKALMNYFVLRQAKGGATIAARVQPAQQNLILQDLEKIVKSMQIQ